MPGEQSGKVPCSDPHPLRQGFDGRTFSVERTFFGDESNRALNNSAAPPPCRTERRGFRTATQARATTNG
jgi:hypothetical protein